MAKGCKTDLTGAMPGDELYRKSYMASLTVLKNVVPFIKSGDDVGEKLSHSAKEVPRLIATGLHECMTEIRKSHVLGEAALLCSESVVMLSFCRDLHGQFINGALCGELIDTYQTIGDEIGRIVRNPDEASGGKL